MIWTVSTVKNAPRDLGIVNEPTRGAAQRAAETNPGWWRVEHGGRMMRRLLPLYVKLGETQGEEVHG